MPEHSPETWTIGKAPEEPDTYLIGSEGLLWCRVVGAPDKPAWPRARLIAAAPELLEAAEMLLDAPHDAARWHARKLLTKAIAKAKGVS